MQACNNAGREIIKYKMSSLGNCKCTSSDDDNDDADVLLRKLCKN